MKAEDLMIHDCVIDKTLNTTHIVTAQDIFALAENTVNESNFEPIPLTKELLANNGFERFDTTIGNYWLYIRVEKVRDIKDYSNREFYQIQTYLPGGCLDGWFEIENRTQEEYYSCKINCKYVHELQHALRICRLNEIANDFKFE